MGILWQEVEDNLCSFSNVVCFRGCCSFPDPRKGAPRNKSIFVVVVVVVEKIQSVLADILHCCVQRGWTDEGEPEPGGKECPAARL